MGGDCGSGACVAGVEAGAATGPGAGESCSACHTACGGDPIACACAMWTASFFQAMKQAQVDALKAKIQKAWGAKMDKAADIILEAMGAKWRSMVAEASAKVDVRERLTRLWQEGQK